MSDWIVTVEYKNRDMETVVEKEYDFIQYTELLHSGLMKIIKDVEDVFYKFSGYKQKEDWSPELTQSFDKIRHKLLDEANSIRRLPNTLSYKGHKANEMTIGEFISRTMK